ncbi:hypothetical protein C495_07318 [Natronorubrum sulfidifaciens JCM 14089]|uniref:Uncharacterized protein n=1 Tax=Natronorubrum sulfidifaciens JCM 14089 TaxID=1230460 RepID=L9WA82_9EURY|nr:hypothetical protein C495_07318 [Natronorubrum sulfidifaciens JCM 14089]
MTIGLEWRRIAIRRVGVFDTVTVCTKDDAPVDFFSYACLRVTVNDHCRDTVFLLVRMMKVETRWPALATLGTLTMELFVRVEPLANFFSAPVLSLDSGVSIFIIPTLLTCKIRPIGVIRNVNPIRFRLDRMITRCAPIERF